MNIYSIGQIQPGSVNQGETKGSHNDEKDFLSMLQEKKDKHQSQLPKFEKSKEEGDNKGIQEQVIQFIVGMQGMQGLHQVQTDTLEEPLGDLGQIEIMDVQLDSFLGDREVIPKQPVLQEEGVALEELTLGGHEPPRMDTQKRYQEYMPKEQLEDITVTMTEGKKETGDIQHKESIDSHQVMKPFGEVTEEKGQKKIVKEEDEINPTQKSTEKEVTIDSLETPQTTTHEQGKTNENKPQVYTLKVDTPEELPEKIGNLLNQKIANNQKIIEVHLQPKELGKITLKAVFENNQTSIEILCSNSKTLELLAGNSKGIEHIMEQNLGRTTVVLVENDNTDYLQQEHQQQGRDNQSKEQENQKDSFNQNGDGSWKEEDFLQQLRLGIAKISR